MNIRYYDTAIYKYGDSYKIVYLKRFQGDTYKIKEFDNEEKKVGDKYLNNIIRAKSTVLGLSLCNDWDYFCTFTLNPQKYNRYNLDNWRKDFTQWIRNQRRITGDDWQFILIPELHKDGAWHMHGLIKGCSWDKLVKFKRGVHPLSLVNAGYRYHDGIFNKFGFNSFAKIKSKQAVSRYITKYITKDMATCGIMLGNHLYYCSRGLKKPELIKQGCTTSMLTRDNFENDFMACKWITKDDFNRINDFIL